jgi:hypothetical protein
VAALFNENSLMQPFFCDQTFLCSTHSTNRALITHTHARVFAHSFLKLQVAGR